MPSFLALTPRWRLLNRRFEVVGSHSVGFRSDFQRDGHEALPGDCQLLGDIFHADRPKLGGAAQRSGVQRIGIPRETFPLEKRVATVPDVVEKLVKLGFQVAVESGAGEGANFPLRHTNVVFHSVWNLNGYLREFEALRVRRRPPSLALRRACGQRLIPIVSVLCFSRRHVTEWAEQPPMVIPMVSDPFSTSTN